MARISFFKLMDKHPLEVPSERRLGNTIKKNLYCLGTLQHVHKI